MKSRDRERLSERERERERESHRATGDRRRLIKTIDYGGA